jgi:hypothetical protein
LIADQKLPDNDLMQSCGPLESFLASASNITPLQITARPSLFSLVEIEPSDLALEASYEGDLLFPHNALNEKAQRSAEPQKDTK